VVIDSYSAWYYGHEVSIDNQIIPLDEGFGELAVEVTVGSYSLTNFVTFVNASLNEFSSQEYNVNIDRSTRLITISAPANFSLLFGTSLNESISLRTLLGFDQVDYTGSNSYTAPNPSGFAYYPQFKLQKFFDFDMIQRANAETVRATASGKVEVVKYSNNYFMKCTIPYITDIVNQGLIKNNPTGLADAIAFIQYATTKNDMEFVYDVETPTTFQTCILESTGQSRSGTDYELSPLYSRGLTGYYELKSLTFRRID